MHDLLFLRHVSQNISNLDISTIVLYFFLYKLYKIHRLFTCSIYRKSKSKQIRPGAQRDNIERTIRIYKTYPLFFLRLAALPTLTHWQWEGTSTGRKVTGGQVLNLSSQTNIQ